MTGPSMSIQSDKFDLVNDKFIVHREVEKMSKSKYNVVNPDEICDIWS